MFCLPFQMNFFHSTSYVCILCAFVGCVKITPCNFISTCLCSNTQLGPILGVCNRKNGGSEDICYGVDKVSYTVWFMSCGHNW
jgi:hypothetical protein